MPSACSLCLERFLVDLYGLTALFYVQTIAHLYLNCLSEMSIPLEVMV
jgi:hypothetical protein